MQQGGSQQQKMTLAVADSSYITEGLLKDSSLFKGYILCSPDYGLYEILNAVWKLTFTRKKVLPCRTILAERKRGAALNRMMW